MMGIESIDQCVDNHTVLKNPLTCATELGLPKKLLQGVHPDSQSFVCFVPLHELSESHDVSEGPYVGEDQFTYRSLPSSIDQTNMLRFKASQEVRKLSPLVIFAQLRMETLPPQDFQSSPELSKQIERTADVNYVRGIRCTPRGCVEFPEIFFGE
jgi:hypothetical protein